MGEPIKMWFVGNYGSSVYHFPTVGPVNVKRRGPVESTVLSCRATGYKTRVQSCDLFESFDAAKAEAVLRGERFAEKSKEELANTLRVLNRLRDMVQPEHEPEEA